jgi:hypothetical protein
MGGSIYRLDPAMGILTDYAWSFLRRGELVGSTTVDALAELRSFWHEHAVSRYTPINKRIHHPIANRMVFEYNSFTALTSRRSSGEERPLQKGELHRDRQDGDGRACRGADRPCEGAPGASAPCLSPQASFLATELMQRSGKIS